MKALVDAHFPDAQVIRVVLHNLNTHTPALLYEALPPAEAHRLTRQLEFRYTPKHGSWQRWVQRNMAEIELSLLSRQCLDRRLPEQDSVARECAAWEAARNAAHIAIYWRFTADDARTKLGRLYPSVSL